MMTTKKPHQPIGENKASIKATIAANPSITLTRKSGISLQLISLFLPQTTGITRPAVS
ncbi:hypothetical protein KHM83_15700 [Fusibacter paucivorans]|uniref:Uncharacterized protein n=1 Tax=Fusibacter paucivorans TaxID=76009 RepID=A0ABS5PSS5_9FIRM|nr:hypothetical protein [Fusibacter paucivorans]MBS7528131.1 hypothetical protein [Fusibacter paucivorans]